MAIRKDKKQRPAQRWRMRRHFLQGIPAATILLMTATAVGQTSPTVYYWSWDPADALARVEAQIFADEAGATLWSFPGFGPGPAPPPPLPWIWSNLPPVPPPAPPAPAVGPPLDWDLYPPDFEAAGPTVYVGPYFPSPSSDLQGNPPPPPPPDCDLDWDLRVNLQSPIGLVFQDMLGHPSVMPEKQLTNDVFAEDGSFVGGGLVSGEADQVITVRSLNGMLPSTGLVSAGRTWELRFTNAVQSEAELLGATDRFVTESAATIIMQIPVEIHGLTPGVTTKFTIEFETLGEASNPANEDHLIDPATMTVRDDVDNAYSLANVDIYTDGNWTTQFIEYAGDPPGFPTGTHPPISSFEGGATFLVTPTTSTYPIVLRLTVRARTYLEDDPRGVGIDTASASIKGNVWLTVFSPPPFGVLEDIPANGPEPTYGFWMSKFEVNNQEFADFLNDTEEDVAAGGSDKSAFMVFDTTTGQIHTPGGELMFEPIVTPTAGGGTLQKIRYRPSFPEGTRYVVDPGAAPDAVVGVTWIGALKYCNWLTLHMGYPASDRCYTEGDTLADWHPVTTTAAQWAAGDLSDAQRADLVANYRGFRLPMDNLRSATGYISNQVNEYNEWYKASAYDPSAPNTTRTGPGGESVPPMHWTYGFGRDSIDSRDANYVTSGDIFDDGVAHIGYFDGVNELQNGDVTRDTDNPFGLYDLAGNVAEWGQDQTANGRALRTGSWQESAGETAAARRDEADPGTISSEIGFRVVTTHEPPQPCASTFPACPADLDGDSVVNAADLLELLGDWDSDVSCADLDQSGNVSTPDLLMLLANWGMCPGATSFAYDSGATDLSLGLTSDGVIGWLHRFDAGSGNVIENIATTYGTPALGGQTGVNPGDPVGYAILTDTGNGPGDVIWMSQDAIDVNAIGNDGLQVLPVPDIPVAGNFYIAAWVEVPASTYPAPMDQTVTLPDDVWLFGTLGATFSDFDPQNPGFVFNMDDEGFPTVWMLRANE